MPLVDDFLIAGGRDDKVGVAGRLDHGHDAETVHDRFKGAVARPRSGSRWLLAPRAHGNASSAPAVAGHGKHAPGHEEIRRAE
jgi:hypothetical protein